MFCLSCLTAEQQSGIRHKKLLGLLFSTGSQRLLEPLNCVPFLFSSSGGHGAGEELPQTHGVLHAADLANSMEHANGERCFISFTVVSAYVLLICC